MDSVTVHFDKPYTGGVTLFRHPQYRHIWGYVNNKTSAFFPNVPNLDGVNYQRGVRLNWRLAGEKCTTGLR